MLRISPILRCRAKFPVRSFDLALSDNLHECCLGALITNRLCKADPLPDTQVIEAISFDAIAVEVDFAAIGSCDKPVVLPRMERGNNAMRGRFM